MSDVLYIAMVLVALGAIALVQGVRRSMRWPEPSPRPYYCSECRDWFKTGALLAMHIRAQHQELLGPLREHLVKNQQARTKQLPKQIQPSKLKRKQRARPKLRLVR